MDTLIRSKTLVSILLGLLLLASCSQRPSEEDLALYARAASYFESGRLAEAVTLSTQLGAFYPAAVLRAKALALLGKDEDAEKALCASIRLRPSSTEARLWLARVLRSQGSEAARAEKLVENLIADDPSDIRALRLAAELALDSGDLARSRIFLDRAVEAASESGLAFLDRARLRWTAGDREGAQADLASALSLLPPQSAAYRASRSLEASLAVKMKEVSP
ncbi:hypothetical protein MASR2M78_17850 [Treponema sp.]